MQERTTVGRPYAQAAFDIAREQQQVAQWSQMLAVAAVALQDQTLRSLVHDPRITAAQLYEIIDTVAGGQLSTGQQNFLKLLIEAERVEYLPEIAAVFQRLRDDAENRVTVDVVSAFDLSDEERTRIRDMLHQRVGRAVELECSTDKSLIGGAVIRINDTVIDLSVRGKLQALASGLS
ncbi:MAG: F0F1 ATP synthase subunit delta [Gammaproteobacteria bacterium]|nr:F0F1 ATP synthase subunit delta [Gammaproteobacteria bacterium]